jgi:centromere protein S
MDPDLDLDLDMDMETLADDADAALAGDSGGEAERNEAAEAEAEVERYEAAEAEADILRDRFRLAVISIATAEGMVASSRASLRYWELKSPEKSSSSWHAASAQERRPE